MIVISHGVYIPVGNRILNNRGGYLAAGLQAGQAPFRERAMRMLWQNPDELRSLRSAQCCL